MSNKKPIATPDADQAETRPVAGRTVEASSHFGQIAYTASLQVSEELFAILANEGFEGRLASASSKLDAHAQFGHFGHTGADGKPVERSREYKRGKTAFSPERAELVRSHLATQSFPNVVVAVTTSRYESSAVKAVTVDQAGTIVAKNAITKRGDNPQELAKLAQTVGYAFDATSELTVENLSFVEAVATFYANL
jgi:hypothetical protein